MNRRLAIIGSGAFAQQIINIIEDAVEPFEVVKREGNLYTFEGVHVLPTAGSFKVACRMYPKNVDLPHRQDFCYVKWVD